MSKAFDKFYDDVKKIENLDKEITKQLKEREILQGKAQSTGKIDYFLKTQGDSIKYEINALQKTSYLYQSEPQKFPDL